MIETSILIPTKNGARDIGACLEAQGDADGHHGFLAVRFGYHQMIPTLSSPKGEIFDIHIANQLVEKLFSRNSIFEKLWPIHKLSTSIFAVRRKVEAFHG
jgi:hypothetical protein